MKIGVPKEILDGERRVAIVPKMINELKKENEVLVEKNAGKSAYFSDSEYESNGALIIQDAAGLFVEANLILKVQPPRKNNEAEKHEIEMMKDGSLYIGLLAPLTNREVIERMLKKGIASFAMEYIPRISRAQSMDVLSSMANIAGYKAILIAAQKLGKFLPLMMTAAGTIPAAKVLVVGAGVAGLQAIATARRLGAKVEAFDVRPAVKEQVESLGGQFVAMKLSQDSQAAGGYAKEMSEEFLKLDREAIASCLPKSDVVITTAQVFGKRAPVLITEEMIKLMKEGSIIIDLAAEQGGNCELTKAGQDIVKYGIIIHGAVNLAASLPYDASQMYSRNIVNFFKILKKKDDGSFNFEDEIVKSTCITYNGEIINESVNKAYSKGETA